MNFVSSAASACLWINIKSGGCYLVKWNTGGFGVALLRSFWAFCRGSGLAVLFCCIVMFRSAARVVLSNTSLKVSAVVLYL